MEISVTKGDMAKNFHWPHRVVYNNALEHSTLAGNNALKPAVIACNNSFLLKFPPIGYCLLKLIYALHNFILIIKKSQ